MTTIPATAFGPEVAPIPEQPARDLSQRAKPAFDRPESLKEGRSAARGAQVASSTLLPGILSGSASAWLDRGLQPKRSPNALLAQFAGYGYEAGTSWIGPSQGLPGSPGNAQGFVDELSAVGYDILFNWGEANAFESDWNADDDSYVDAADIVFYTGHASKDGWVLNAPGDTFLHYSEVGAYPESPGDLWGNNDVEWIIIAACGPLQHDSLNGGGNVFDRWRGVFDGLHSLMGYGAVTYDNTEEGRKLIQYAKGGTPLIDAWFRTAQEVQPSTNNFPSPDGPNVYAAALYGYNSVYDDPRYDHLWGYGSVALDSPGATSRWFVWTGT